MAGIVRYLTDFGTSVFQLRYVKLDALCLRQKCRPANLLLGNYGHILRDYWERMRQIEVASSRKRQLDLYSIERPSEE